MTEQKKEFKVVRTLRRAAALTVAAGLLAVLFFGAGFFAGGKRTEHPPALDAVVVQNRMEQVSQLATAKYYYTNMGQFEQHGEFYGVKLPFSTKRFIVSYDGNIQAGIRLRDAAVEISETRLTVTLPAAEIFSHEMDEDSLQVFDETRSIFNPITIEDYNGFLADQKDAMEAKAIANGLLDDARTNAGAVLEPLLRPLAEAYQLELIIQ